MASHFDDLLHKWLLFLEIGLQFENTFCTTINGSASPMDQKKTATGLDHNQKGPICKQLVLTGLWLHNNISKNPCENALKTINIWVFTCFFFFFDKLLHLIKFCDIYILYNIIPKIRIQNPSVLCVISYKNCCFHLFSPVFNCTSSKLVAVASCLFLGWKTRLDRTCEH